MSDQVWLRDKRTGIECGKNEDGDLFLGDGDSGSTLPDTRENRKRLIANYRYWISADKRGEAQ